MQKSLIMVPWLLHHGTFILLFYLGNIAYSLTLHLVCDLGVYLCRLDGRMPKNFRHRI